MSENDLETRFARIVEENKKLRRQLDENKKPAPKSKTPRQKELEIELEQARKEARDVRSERNNAIENANWLRALNRSYQARVAEQHDTIKILEGYLTIERSHASR